MDFQDLIYEERDGVARITINRPEKYNAFTARTADELIRAFSKAGWDPDIGVIVLTGVGDKAFCTGGDQSIDSHDGSFRHGIVGANGPNGTACPARVSPVRALREE